MALINCPECKKEVSSYATICPHCGYPIKVVSYSQNSNTELENIMVLGMRAFESENFIEANEYFKKALLINPQSWKAILYEGLSVGWLTTKSRPHINDAIKKISLSLDLMQSDKLALKKAISDTNILISTYQNMWKSLPINISDNGFFWGIWGLIEKDMVFQNINILNSYLTATDSSIAFYNKVIKLLENDTGANELREQIIVNALFCCARMCQWHVYNNMQTTYKPTYEQRTPYIENFDRLLFILRKDYPHNTVNECKGRNNNFIMIDRSEDGIEPPPDKTESQVKYERSYKKQLKINQEIEKLLIQTNDINY